MKRHSSAASLTLAALVALGLACPVAASTFGVLNVADDGFGSLRAAIAAANAQPGADVIHFTRQVRGTITLTSGQLDITDDVEIRGPGAARLAVSGSHLSRIFRISGGAKVTIAGLTITEGMAFGAPGDGGGILNTGGTLSLARVVLSNNQAVGTPGAAGRGGAIANVSGAILTVTHCRFTQNQALGGTGGGQGDSGAIFNAASDATVSHSRFIANQAIGGTGGGPARAGGINNINGSTTTITDSIFTGNQAIAGDASGNTGFGRGGGIYNNAGTVTVENSTFQGNLARGGSNNTRSAVLVGLAGGAGIFNADEAILFLTGSSFTGNQALGGSNNTSTGRNGDVGFAFGGGLANVGEATITDSTFEDNEARGGSGNRGDPTSFQFVGTAMGGAIFTSAENTSSDPVSLTLNNVTLRRNQALGGDDNTAGTFVNAGIGGGLVNIASNAFVTPSGGSTTTLGDSTVADNQAVGGQGDVGDSGGATLGGGVANLLGGVLTVSGSTLTGNQVRGGASDNGGSGQGGGLFNDGPSTHPSNPGAPTILVVSGSTVTGNEAVGGTAGESGEEGAGIGGGLYLTPGGEACVELVTAIFGNRASTSHDDIFGDLEECRERG